MPLPKLTGPKIACNLPLSGKKIFFRPMIVREQKELLLAQQSQDDDTIYATIRNVIMGCTDGAVDLEEMPIPDLSWLFLQMKIASSGPEQKISVKCDHCKEQILMQHDLSGAKVDTSKANLKIELTPEVGIIFRWPTIMDYVDAFKSKDATLKYIFMIVDQVYDSDQVYTKSMYTEEEFNSWLEELNDAQIAKIRDFMVSIPELKQELNYKCPHCDHEHRKLLEGLQDFFRFDNDQREP
jgi:hypothetical protein